MGMWFLVVFLLNLTIGGLATEYVFEFWLSYFKGVPIDIPFLLAALAGLFFGQFTIPAALLTLLLSFAL